MDVSHPSSPSPTPASGGEDTSKKVFQVRDSEPPKAQTIVKPAKKPIRSYRLRDLATNPFIVIRRIYHSYFLVLAAIFLFVVGLNLMMQVLFSIFLPRVSSNRNFFFVAFGLVGLILLLGFFVSSVVASGFLLLLDAWTVDEFLFYRRTITFDDGVNQRLATSGTFRGYLDKGLQYFILISFDVLPITMFFVYVAVDGTSGGTNAFFLTALAVSSAHTLILWFMTLVKDYIDKALDLVKVFRDPKVADSLESFKKSTFLNKIFGTANANDMEEDKEMQDSQDVRDSTASPSGVAPGIPPSPAVRESTGLTTSVNPLYGSDQECAPAAQKSIAVPPNKSRTTQHVAGAIKRFKRHPVENEGEDLNICVDIAMCLQKPSVKMSFRFALMGIVIALIVIGLVLGPITLFLFGVLLFFIAFLIWFVSFVARSAPSVGHEDGSPLFHAMTTFFRKNCGVERFMMLRFCTMIFLLAVMLSLIMIFGQMYVALAISCMLAVAVLIVAVTAYKFPHMLWVVILAECIFFFVTLTVNNFVVFGAVIGGTSLALCFCTQVFLTRKLRTSFTFLAIVLFVFLIFSLLLFSLGYYASLSGPTEVSSGSKTFLTPHNPYEFCSQTWGSGLTIVDFAMFSKVAYNADATFTADFAAWFPSNWTMISYQATSDSVTFYHLYNNRTSTTVYAIRGTASAIDVIQDVDIWHSIALFQLASSIGPSFRQTSLIDIIYWSSFVERSLSSSEKRYYFDPLLDYIDVVSATMTPLQKNNTFITGHSLGGGLAKIVGARRNIPAITFSAPGLYYTSKSVDVDLADLRRMGVTIVPQRDVVPRVDDQAATVLQIDCDESVPTCHKITLTLCQLMRACGDPQGRGVGVDVCPSGF
eukprot:ANDGO_02247.mRNA.1 hypothetical protein